MSACVLNIDMAPATGPQLHCGIVPKTIDVDCGPRQSHSRAHRSEGLPVSTMYRSLSLSRYIQNGQGLAHIFCLDETTFNEFANPGTCSRWIGQDEMLGINERTDDETRRSVEVVREFQKNVVESNDSLLDGGSDAMPWDQKGEESREEDSGHLNERDRRGL